MANHGWIVKFTTQYGVTKYAVPEWDWRKAIQKAVEIRDKDFSDIASVPKPVQIDLEETRF